ncbi:MAG: hypothetical protein IJS46_05505 [Kiritimatiellae bacterium]|nr:hypothetical protein [Kiritimatiellia bacterium]
MQSEEIDTEDIPETDIVFECPHCSKSLSIDQRGAGLVIRCTQCGEPVTVPIPEGMEIEDFDATPEQLSAQLLQTRQALAKALKQSDELASQLAAAIAERDILRKAAKRREQVAAPFRASMAKAVRESELALATLREVAASAAEMFAPPSSEKKGDAPAP